jgi:hypothetical protein
LPRVTIIKNGIDDTGCEDFGNYTIKGTVKGKGLHNTKGAIIPFSFPDSSGLCDIEVNGDNVTMKCYNKEKFKHSSIILGQTIIQDSNKKEIFILNSYINKKSFACAISTNSSNIIIPNSTIPSITSIPSISSSNSPNSNIPSSSSSSKSDSVSNTVRLFRVNKSSGLNGGIIAGIIIAIAAAIAIVIGFAIYFKGKMKNLHQRTLNSSERIKMQAHEFTYKV